MRFRAKDIDTGTWRVLDEGRATADPGAELPPVPAYQEARRATIHKARIGYLVHWDGLFIPHDGAWHWSLTLRGARRLARRWVQTATREPSPIVERHEHDA